MQARLQRAQPNVAWPAVSTIGNLLRRHGLTVLRRHRRRASPTPPPLTAGNEPNRVWCADFKGWFRTQDGERCDPLTISDAASRYLLRCQAVTKPDGEHVQPLFEATFREFGLPRVLRSDNGPPFATLAVHGLSRLAVWWIKLGIYPERIEPEYPAAMEVRRVVDGVIRWRRRKVFVGKGLNGERIGLEQIGEGLWRVWFSFYTLGLLDEREWRLLGPSALAVTPARPKAGEKCGLGNLAWIPSRGFYSVTEETYRCRRRSSSDFHRDLRHLSREAPKGTWQRDRCPSRAASDICDSPIAHMHRTGGGGSGCFGIVSDHQNRLAQSLVQFLEGRENRL